MRLLNGAILLVYLVTCYCQTPDLLLQTCSETGSWATIQNGADAIIGGLLCTAPYADLQSYEAIRYVLDLLNKENFILNGEFLNTSYIPGVKLGMRVNSVCGESEAAIAGATRLFPQLLSSPGDCTQNNKLLLGIIGTSSSGNSMAVSKYLENYNIPVISYESTSPSLSNAMMYPNFMRTVPPDGPLMDVIVSVLEKLNWKYITIIYENTVYGRASYDALLPRLTTAGICLTTAIRHRESDSAASTLQQAIISGTTGVIYFGGPNVARQLLDQGEIIPGSGKLQWIFTDALPFNADYSPKVYQRGVISIVSTSRFIVEVEDHWVRIDENNPSPENPWFKEWYMEQNNCRLQGVTEPASRPECQIKNEREKRATFRQNSFVEPAVHSVFAYAYALRAAHRALCGINAVGMCPQLQNLTQTDFFNNYLKNVDFTYGTDERIPSLASDVYAPYFAAKRLKFDENGDIINPSYDIWNFNELDVGGATGEGFKRVGSYIYGRLDMNSDNVQMYSEDRQTPLEDLPASLCPGADCGKCLGLPPETKYFFQDGDVILTGMFSIHTKGISPLTCGNFDGDTVRPGVQFLQGMIYALYRIVSNQDILRGVRLGGLAFDDCYSPTLATSTLTQVHQGNLNIQDSTGRILDPRKIDGYTAALTNAVTFPIAELMNIFERPLLAYASPDDDLLEYPYYLRTLYGSRYEKRAIIKMIKRLGYHYVQVVYEDMDYFRKSVDDIRMIAAEEDICVVAAVKAEEDGSDTIEMLRQRRSVRPVILNVNIMQNKKILEGIAQLNATGEFALFAIHTFNYDDVVMGNEAAAEGVISVGLKHSSLVQYQTYLSGLRVDSHKQINPWFEEWYEHSHDCYLGSTNPRNYPGSCMMTANTSVSDGKNYKLMYYQEATINAVYAFAYGLNATLSQYCGNNYNGVCEEFRNANDKGRVLVEKIKEVSFSVENAPYLIRFNNKQLDQPFIYYNYNNGMFRKIGEYEGLNNRIIMTDTPRFYNNVSPSYYMPTCPRTCSECFYMFQSQDYMYIDGDLIIPGIFDVHDADMNMSPFMCGDIRIRHGFQYVEAFKFALNRINSGAANVGLNNNLRLGGLAFDGCGNALRATTIMNAFQSNSWMLKDNTGMMIDSSKTLAWMSYDSQSTIKMADILASLGLPIISPGATSPMLIDKQRFSTFFRTIPSEAVLAKGMADLTKSLGFNYVITLNAPDTASREGRDMYREYLKAHGICILESYEFVTDGSNDIIFSAMNKSTTRVVALFAEASDYVEDMIQKTRGSEIIFISNRKLMRRPLVDVAQNSLSFDITAPTVQDFLDYLQTQNVQTSPNPWFREYYEARFNCQVTNILANPNLCADTNIPLTSRDFEQDLYVLSTINAVYSLAKGVHLTLEEKCGVGYTTICSSFKTNGDTYNRIMANMDMMNFTDIVNQFFRFVEREGNQQFTVTQYLINSDREVASFDQNTLTFLDEDGLRNIYRNVPSRCVDNCEVCADSDNNFDDFTFDVGEVYIVGLFDVHKKGATPFTCGDINDKHGIQLLEAFRYAIEYVNNKTGIFRDKLEGVTLGGVGLDVCQNPTRAANLVTNIQSQNIKLINSLYGTQPIDPKFFDVYIGPFDTESTIRVADVLDALSIPQITYGATSLELQDAKKYRYFLRTVPADDKQARAIISYLKRFDNNFVQVISTYNSVGLKGKEEFMRLAPLNRICVEKEIIVGFDGPVTVEEANNALNQLRSNYSAKTVILFVDDPRVLLQAVEQNSDIRDRFFFIGTDKWGMDENILVGLDRLIQNEHAVTLDVETADIPEFDQYLQYKTPMNYDRNPWFRDYYERVFRCNIDATSTRYPEQCTNSMLGVSRNPDYIQDPYVLYVINAVFSTALGLHDTLRDLCSARNDPTKYYYGVCRGYRDLGERRQTLFRNIKKVEFTDDTTQPFYYLPTGESDRGYHIYKPEIDLALRRYSYSNVGSYNDTHYLKIDIRYDMKFESPCIEGVSCPCVFPRYEPSRYMVKPSPFEMNLVYVADIHKQSSTNPYGCGALTSLSNFQSLLAFFFAIEKVNTNARLPASLKLGGLAIDTCSQPQRIGQDVYSLLSGEGLCFAGEQGQIISPSSIISFHALTSGTSIPLSRILTPYKIVSLSPGATSVQLNNKLLHPYFLRTVPPDNIQVRVMLEIMKVFNWDYASIIYTNSPYGISARDALVDGAAITNLKTCFGFAHMISSNTNLAEVEEIVVRLSQRVGARVVILFTEPDHTRLILQAVKNKGLTGRFVWLGSDFWANSMEIVEGYEEEAVGAITIQMRSEFVQSFNNFMTSLTFTNRRGIPDDWFEEFYQYWHKCRLLNSQVMMEYPRVCSETEVITESSINQDPFILHTIIAVYQIAEGLNNLQACRSSGYELSACLSVLGNRRDLIYQSVLGTQFNVLPEELSKLGFTFKFTPDGYGDIGYTILNFHRDVTQDRYVYTKIGTYQQSLNITRALYRGVSILSIGVIPISTCPPSINCSCFAGGAFLGAGVIAGGSMGAGVIQTQGAKTYTYQHIGATASFIAGEDGSYLDPKTGALLVVNGVREGADRFFDIWGIIIATLAAIGAFIALCMFIYLLVVYPVRSGTTILGFLLLFGIILMYLLVFAFVFHASPEVCALRRFALGFVYALVYAVLFVKLVDFWRSRNAEDYSAVKYTKMGTPLGLLFLVLMLVLVQVIICAEWLILVAPGVTSIYYNQFIWPLCAPVGYYDIGLVLSLVYVMLLIILCVIFGFACFSCPRNYYESRWILGIAILSIPTWVIWCLVAVLADYKFRDAAVAVGLLLNATYMLLCGSLRKLYLLNKYQPLFEEEERELENDRRSLKTGSVYSYGAQYDNAGHFHPGAGSVHGSVHGSRHGTASRYGYARNGARLYSAGSSVHGYEGRGGKVIVNGQGGSLVNGQSGRSQGYIIQEGIHSAAEGSVESGRDKVMMSAEGVSGSSGAVVASSSGGHYSEVVSSGDGGGPMSETFRSSNEVIQVSGFMGPSTSTSYHQHTQYEVTREASRSMDYEIVEYDFDN